MIKFFYLLLIAPCLTLGSMQVVYSQSGWEYQFSGTSKRLNSICFTNSKTGWICGDSMMTGGTGGGIVLKTTNSGGNWTKLFEIPTALYAITFTSSLTGYCVGGRAQNPYQYYGLVMKTINGGLSWVSTYLGSGYFNDVFFINELTGWIVAGAGTLYKTTNSGLDWIAFATVSMYDFLISIYFIDTLNGYICGGRPNDSCFILKTTNGGLNWMKQSFNFSQYLYSIYFIDINTGWSVGSQSLVLRTTNAGMNWTKVELGDYYSFKSVTFHSQNTGFIVSYFGFIFRTTNGGINWQVSENSTGLYSNEIYFTSRDTGWIVGNSGGILRTTTGGWPIGIVPISNEIRNSFSLHQNYPNPFNPVTKIRFDIPPLEGARGRTVRLIVYDILGREVATLVNEQLSPGMYEAEWDGSNLASGVYFYSLITKDFSQTRKLILLK